MNSQHIWRFCSGSSKRYVQQSKVHVYFFLPGSCYSNYECRKILTQNWGKKINRTTKYSLFFHLYIQFTFQQYHTFTILKTRTKHTDLSCGKCFFFFHFFFSLRCCILRWTSIVFHIYFLLLFWSHRPTSERVHVTWNIASYLKIV